MNEKKKKRHRPYLRFEKTMVRKNVEIHEETGTGHRKLDSQKKNSN